MEIKDMIYRRKSFRNYLPQPLSEEVLGKIEEFITNAKRLYPEEKLSWEIIGPEKVKTIMPWRAPHNIAIYAERKTEALVNLGFVFQQVDLYIQSLGLGSCWLGLGKPAEETTGIDGLECVMMMAFGKSKEFHRMGAEDFTRKSIAEISDTEDTRLEAARLAPSAINSQPWRFVHEGNTVHTYCMERFFSKQMLGDMNKMDVGIALSHIYAENSDTFRFFAAENAQEIKGNLYIGSFEI